MKRCIERAAVGSTDRILVSTAANWARRDGRVAEGARLESVYTFTGIGGSNPSLSATLFVLFIFPEVLCKLAVRNCANRINPCLSHILRGATSLKCKIRKHEYSSAIYNAVITDGSALSTREDPTLQHQRLGRTPCHPIARSSSYNLGASPS